MGKNRENKEKNHKLPALKSETDALMVDMKVQGKSNREIAKAVDVPVKTVANVLSKGGRLYEPVSRLRTLKTEIVIDSNINAWEELAMASNPAIKELIRMSLNDPNSVVRLKAIDMILDLTGAKTGDKPPMLDPLDMDKSVKKLLKWVNTRLIGVYGDNAPTIDRQAVSIDQRDYLADKINDNLVRVLNMFEGIEKERENEGPCGVIIEPQVD